MSPHDSAALENQISQGDKDKLWQEFALSQARNSELLERSNPDFGMTFGKVLRGYRRVLQVSLV